MTESAEIVPDATEQREAGLVLYNPDNDFKRLALDSWYVSQGFRLIQKEQLEAVPFVIKRVIYREGFPQGPEGLPGDYISVECVVASQDVLDSAPVRAAIASRDYSPGVLDVFPNEAVVFNDGGTGIRRELTSMFADAGLISFAEARKDEIPADLPFTRWASGWEQATAGFDGSHVPGGRQALYLALRGLRASHYDWHGNDATTWYFG